MELAAHWHSCQNLPKKRVNTLLLYKERDDPVKDGLANWRTRSGTLEPIEERYCSSGTAMEILSVLERLSKNYVPIRYSGSTHSLIINIFHGPNPQ